MDPYVMAFLFGVGVGLTEEDTLICPTCGHEFPAEQMDSLYGECVCPACCETIEGN